MNRKYTYLIMGLFLIGITFMGGTYAWLTWSTGSSQTTEVVFTIESDFMCSVDGGGNITSNDVSLVPTTCNNSTYAIQREIKVMPTINNNISVSMDLWLDINDIGTGLSNSQNFKYALTTSSTSCTSGVVASGTFNGKITGGQASLFTEKAYESTTTDTYYLYVWLDEEEISTSTMNQTFNLSLNGSCTDMPLGTVYAVYSADDNSLRFYKTSDVITEGSSYNGLTATAVYTGFEDKIYYSRSSVPWSSYRESITNVVVEDEISPISTAYWFYEFRYTTNMDLEKLDTSSVTNMDSMFYETGYIASMFELIGLDNWNVSNVTNMNSMFYRIGYATSSLGIGNISNWNTSNVTNMNWMFYQAGYSATYSLNLSNWNVSKVTGYLYFNYGVESKITSPVWVN